MTAKCWKLTTFLLNCSHFFKIYHYINEFCGHFWILQSYFESCSQVIADFEILQSHFELWPQNVEIYFPTNYSNKGCILDYILIQFWHILIKWQHPLKPSSLETIWIHSSTCFCSNSAVNWGLYSTIKRLIWLYRKAFFTPYSLPVISL